MNTQEFISALSEVQDPDAAMDLIMRQLGQDPGTLVETLQALPAPSLDPYKLRGIHSALCSTVARKGPQEFRKIQEALANSR